MMRVRIGEGQTFQPPFSSLITNHNRFICLSQCVGRRQGPTFLLGNLTVINYHIAPIILILFKMKRTMSLTIVARMDLYVLNSIKYDTDD